MDFGTIVDAITIIVSLGGSYLITRYRRPKVVKGDYLFKQGYCLTHGFDYVEDDGLGYRCRSCGELKVEA